MSGSIEGVDAVFVLSVRSFTERIKHIEQHFSARGIDFEFIFDYDPPQLTEGCIEEIFGDSDMGPALKSLIMKNIHAWRLGVERGCRRVLIFEDDVVLSRQFGRKLERFMGNIAALPPGNLVFLGGSDTKVSDDFFLQSGPLIRQPIATAEGYLSDIEALKRRLDWLKANKARIPADHLIRQIDEACGVEEYWLEQPLVEQGSVFGMFDTYLDGSRKKHSRYYNYLRYRWSQFRRRRFRKWWVNLKQLVQ